MTPTTSQLCWRPLFERFLFWAPDPEAPEPRHSRSDDDKAEDEHSFGRRDEAFYWGWSMHSLL